MSQRAQQRQKCVLAYVRASEDVQNDSFLPISLHTKCWFWLLPSWLQPAQCETKQKQSELCPDDCTTGHHMFGGSKDRPVGKANKYVFAT